MVKILQICLSLVVNLKKKKKKHCYCHFNYLYCVVLLRFTKGK